MKKGIVFLLLLLLLSACGSTVNPDDPSTDGGTAVPSSPSTNPTEPSPSGNSGTKQPTDPIAAATSEEAAATILLALKQSDMTTLNAYIHPEKGLLFSPYAHIDTSSAKVFQASGLPPFTDSTVYNWGAYDGSGEPISLTFKQYYEKFVYDKDFLASESVGADEIKGEGNMLVNIKEIFPGSFVMDYYFSGFDEQDAGMDWESLILVLEELNGAWYLSAIVHSQWTI
ncbi:hypothetical protein [Paenibacillus luteus]|uniref:hypothetical protein n=1 Tax=Paenibacillus luteus TaxID=2545753 RepID=UPI00114330FA|nr:hypothetical protein [Paenibacillus luteus]